jgi:hypothetical protein
MGDFMDWLGGVDKHHKHDNDAGKSKRQKKMAQKARRDKAAKLKKKAAEEKGRTTKGSDGTWWTW